MSPVFAKVVNMSISAGILILAVILVRFLFRKLTRKIFLIAWLLVMIRLILPVTLSNTLSPIPADFFSGRTSNTEIAVDTEWQGNVPDHTEIPADAERSGQSGRAAFDTGKLLGAIWIAGTAAILAGAAIKTVKLRRAVKDAVNYRDNVYLSPEIKNSFVLGIVRPQIYIPSGTVSGQLQYIIDHEAEHIRRKDHLLKLLFYVILAAHWFNPLVHIAYHLFSEDLEMACDESTVSGRCAEYRANYIQTLLDCGISSSVMSFGALSFGSIGIKRRVERIMDSKKTRTVTIAVFAVVCLALVFFLMTNHAAAAQDAGHPDENIGGTYVVIRDADGNVVETYDLGGSGLDTTVPSTDFPEYDPVSDEDREKYGDLLKIREEVLKDGVYRSSEEYGDPIYAVCEGEVISSKRDGAYGLCVTIKDDSGRIWKYGHCSKLVAEEGERVSIGDMIAYIGTTGVIEKPGVIIRIVEQ